MALKEKGQEVKKHILAIGKDEIMRSSFNAVGVASISQNAGLPKGSFFYYFPTKEKFGVELFENYMGNYLKKVNQFLVVANNPKKNAYERIRSLHQSFYKKQKANDWKLSCLFMKVYPEIGTISEPMQEVIKLGLDEILQLYGETVQAGVEDKSIVLSSRNKGSKEKEKSESDAIGKRIFMQWQGVALVSSVYGHGKFFDGFFKDLEKIKSK